MADAPKTSKLNDAEIIVSADEERGAAVFVDGLLLLGPEASLRRCLAARQSGEILASSESFRRASEDVAAQETDDAVTYTDEREAARAFVAALIQSAAARDAFRARSEATLGLQRLSYATTVTRFNDEGVERKTRSAFGQFGTIASQLAAQAR
ncbi:MAG: hypothetical protein WKF84_29400 [Pyrinomonadaceae bacterium]